MAKVVTSYGNFAKAKIDHDMGGRFDLPIYQSGADVFENFISNFKGNAIFSSGFISQLAFQECEFIEFKFGNTQNYLCCFYANTIRFAGFDTNGTFGWVLDGIGNILEVATPYTLAQCHTLDYTQNNDVMVVTCSGLEPRKLIRTSANSFTFNTFARLNDPFPTTFAATVAISAITLANPGAVTTAAPHGLATGDRVKITGATGMTEINNYTVTVTVTGANTFTMDINTTGFTAYGGSAVMAKVTAGDYPACCLFYKGRLYYAATPLKGTTIWFSTSGSYDDFTLPVTVTDKSAFNFTIADITQKIEWLFPGDNSLIAGSTDGIVAINGGGVNTAITASSVEANITSAEPTNGSYPIKKDGFVFYIGRTGRNVYFFNYDILNESFAAEDANIVSYDITSSGLAKLRFKKDRNDLIFCLRNDGGICTLNFKKKENILGWHERTTNGTFEDVAVMGDNNGDPQIFTRSIRNGVHYIEMQAGYVEFRNRNDFLASTFEDEYDRRDEDAEAYNRYVAEQLRGCTYLDNAVRYQDLRSTTITYSPGAGTVTASGASFAANDVGKHIVYRTSTGYESGRFLITQYNSATSVNVSVLQTPKQIGGVALNVWSSWYKSFSSISGLAQYNGTTVGVVADGGYLDDFEVSGGAIAFDSQLTSVVIGYKYTGLIKSFCLGFQYQGFNTQTTLKNISRVGVRCVASAGGKVGSSPYHLQPVQHLSQNDINYLPPVPVDEHTEYVDYTDESEDDKFFWAVQDQPLPFQITNLFIEAQYATTS